MADTDKAAIQLRPEPDVILTVHHPTKPSKTWQVSSHVLMIASAYFRALFRSNFGESQAIRDNLKPTITLEKDEPDSMHIILSILHFNSTKDFRILKPETLASVALHSGKYGCRDALEPWIARYFSVEKKKSVFGRLREPHRSPKPQYRSCTSHQPSHQQLAAASRVEDYITWLEASKLWPSPKPFRSCTITEAQSRIVRAPSFLQHPGNAAGGIRFVMS